MGKHSNRAEESGNFMDKLQDEGETHENMPESGHETQPGDSVDQEREDNQAKREAKVDKNALELDIEPEEQEKEEEAKQVESTTVIFVPHKDFPARVNQTEYTFRKGVPHEVSRDMANMLMEDESRGYIRD